MVGRKLTAKEIEEQKNNKNFEINSLVLLEEVEILEKKKVKLTKQKQRHLDHKRKLQL